MSRSLSSVLSRFVLFLGVALLLAGGTTPVFAQGGMSGATGTAPVKYKILGTDIMVNPAGGLVNYLSTCPFDIMKPDQAAKVFADAKKAAKSSLEENGCPYAVDRHGDKIFLSYCGDFYEAASLSLGKASHPNPEIVCCHENAGEDRRNCLQKYMKTNNEVNNSVGVVLFSTGGLSNDPRLTKEQQDKLKADAEAKKSAEEQCFNGTLENIENFWAQKQEVKCIIGVTKIFKKEKKEITEQAVDKLIDVVQKGASESVTTGGFTAVIPLPSPYSAAAAAIAAGKTTATKTSKLLDIAERIKTALDECKGILPQLSQVKAFRENILNNLSCKAVSNLIERQFTQCIRVNLSADFTLPYFSMLLQCPININLDVRYDIANGFRCYNNVTAGSPLQGASFAGRSLLSNNGGLKSVFNGDCFGKSDQPSTGNGVEGSAGSRVPGIDCGPLDTKSILKQETINGVTQLQPGTGTSGWVVGGSEPVLKAKVVNGVTQLQADGVTPQMDATGQVITRCDYMERARIIRTTYVYGSGTSCNAGASGFLDGGYESNTACYPGGYVPAAVPSVPDACMYPSDCMDSSGKFSEARQGSGNCPQPAKPNFNATRTYTVFKGGGLSNTGNTTASCADFDGQVQGATVCCDPQIQDCSKKDANVPICSCDQGDATNVVKSVTQANGSVTLDPEGMCEKGGKVTCCSPRLNGQAWCDLNMNGGTCEDEKPVQCVKAGEGATYLDPSGTSHNITAGDLVASKPSPYIYLFVRPDTKINGQQCCLTEWCNICPQHYANAYGLSMNRSTNNVPQQAIGTYDQSSFDAHNNTILGRGWPFVTTTNDMNVMNYSVGINPLTVTIYKYKWLSFDKAPDDEYDIRISNPQLFLSPDMDRPLQNTLNACNKLSRWQVGIGTPEMFNSGGAEMGFVYDESTGKGKVGKEDVWKIVGPIPRISEKPLTYLNRIRSSQTSSKGTVDPIPLCSDVVQVCTSDALSGNAGATDNSTTAPPVLLPPVTTPAPTPTPTPSPMVQEPAASDATSGGLSAPQAVQKAAPAAVSAPTPGATSVPSATNSGGASGQAAGSLY